MLPRFETHLRRTSIDAFDDFDRARHNIGHRRLEILPFFAVSGREEKTKSGLRGK